MKHLKFPRFLLAFILSAILFFLAFGVYHQWQRARVLLKERRFLEAQLKALKEEEEKIKKEAANLTNEEVLEKEARLSLGLKKPEEKVILIIPEKSSTSTAPISTPLLTKWLNWWHNLFKR